jgi:hypothetical protein
MGRKPKSKIAQAQTLPPVEMHYGGIVEQTLRLARWQRWLMVASFAVAVALLLTPVVDHLYLTYFFSMETRIVPSFVSTGLGVLVYAIGYLLIIGRVGQVPTARRATLWYIMFCLAALALVLILVIIGIYSNVIGN